MGNNAYVLDANVFIEASRRYYAFDLAPGFWNSLIHYANTGQIISIDRIKQELDRGKDNLAQWAGRDFHHAFATTNEDEVVKSYAEIMNWVNSQEQFSDAAKAEFANDPDGWLVAYARVKECIVVTHEVPSVEIKRKVPIPNICQAFSVQFIDTFEMLRRLRVKFM
jgi:hypothetical protein